MSYAEVSLTDVVFDYFENNLSALLNYIEINSQLKEISGINNFFNSQEEATELHKKIKEQHSVILSSDRREYGDFQTNEELSILVTQYALLKSEKIDFILEPTCGKGNFILSAIKEFKSLKKVVGIEIYQPYIWETKFKILTYFLINNEISKPDIDIFHGNAFEFPYEELATTTKHMAILVIGNPPWVTNSELSSISSENLPKKSNFKKHTGFEAITGKGNFDIGEYIALLMLKYFQNHNGIFAFLIKNSVAKNIIHDQKENIFKIKKSEKLNIDSKKEFNVSVNACLFITHLNSTPEFTCKELDFYNKKYITTFGWYKNKFVYSIDDYDKANVIDGKSTLIWRSGVKHDCSKIMELEEKDNFFINGLGEKIKLEKDLVYGLLKSSDLKDEKTNTFRKFTIITQKKIGQETKYIEDNFPLTYQYLSSHKEFFDKRKSSIYKDKPDFSIFGIGEYSFAKYKVGISGLYRSTHFTLISPKDTKPIMLDDTCYFIGFEKLKMAQIAQYLLNSQLVQKFLKSVVFSDSKRSINKDTLMRIDLKMALENSDFESAQAIVSNLTINDWEDFANMVNDQPISK